MIFGQIMDKPVMQQVKRGYCYHTGCLNLQRNHGNKHWGRFCDKHHYDSFRIKHESALRAGKLVISQINTIGYRRTHRLGIVCPDCGLVRLRTKLGIHRRCDSCQYKRRLAVVDRGYGRKRALKKYGLTVAGFKKIADSQGGRCAICGESPKLAGGRESGLVVDHCHSEKVVRGLLCGTCNSGLGMFKDDLDLLASAARYLQNSTMRLSG